MEENEDEDEERALVRGILFCGRQKYTHRLPKWLGRAGATHVVYSTCCTPHYVLYHTVTVYATQGHTMHATCNSMRLRAHMWTRRGFVGGGYRDGGAQGKGFKQGPACPACPGFDINLNPNPVSGPVAANSPRPQLKRDISCMGHVALI